MGKRIWLATAAMLIGGAAQAQETMTLAGGFIPDPEIRDITVTGQLPAADWVRGCPGHVAETPALVIRYTDSTTALRVMQLGEGLAGIVVAGPDGIHRCATTRDAATAALTIEPEQSGDYAVWPAVAVPGATVSARLLVTERSLTAAELFALSGARAGQLMPNGPPAFGTHAMADSGMVATRFSAVAPAEATAGGTCVGWLDPARPDMVLRLAHGEPVLALSVTAEADTTLVVMAPDGTLHCNDDADGMNPALLIANAAGGDWAIWAGTYQRTESGAARIAFGREAPDSQTMGFQLLPGLDAPAAAGSIAPGDSLSLTVAGNDWASDFGPGCLGQIEANRPDAVLMLEAAEPQLVLRVASEADTTLLVVAPDGQVYCDDDTHGFDPALTIRQAAPGRYAIWAGHWDASGTPATLRAGLSPAAVGLDEGFARGRGFSDSPFLGRDIPDALRALDIFYENPVEAGRITYGSRTALGDQGFVLRDVTLSPPTDDTPPLGMESLRVTDLDLEGLSATGAPGRFRITMTGIDYASVAGTLEQEMAFDLPGLEQPSTIGIEISLLPPLGDETRRDLAMQITLEGQMAFGVAARLQWPDSPGMPGDLEALPAEALRVELTNLGYVGLALRAMGVQLGMGPRETGDLLLSGLAQAMAPVMPGSPKARLLSVLGALSAEPDGPGVARMAITADTPQPLNAMIEAVERANGIAPPGMTLDFAYDPMP